MTNSEKIIKALNLIADYGSIDGAHHKQWLLDQIARTLAGQEYESWEKAVSRSDELERDGSPKYMPWDTGIAP